ncbi:hypothetical protein MASR2M48_32470 [Spirochaetota bacterium]
MVYIGDGETDIPCFRLVKKEGGYAIAVYPPGRPDARMLSNTPLKEGRANLSAPADYSPDSKIELERQGNNRWLDARIPFISMA